MKFFIRDLLLVTVIGLASGCDSLPGVYIPNAANPSLESKLAGKWAGVSNPSIQIEFVPDKFLIADSTQNLDQVYDCKFTSSSIVISRDASSGASLLVSVVNEEEIVIEFGDGKKHFKRQLSVPTSSAPAPNPPKK